MRSARPFNVTARLMARKYARHPMLPTWADSFNVTARLMARK
ncbi:MAG: hypothetical protein M2R45_00426 [Verrucomicrobia subdivision 3 bacterium]|nr:hypothetical protein [Limisphaerales bacterium]MCS1413694.1 hypothetical protein [Limisphaerales bacterium]